MTPQRATGEWLRRFHPSPGAAVRLVCFPHAGGSASYYYPMSQLMAPAVEVLALQYPGRQDRMSEACMETISDLADGIFSVLLDWTDRPFAFFGHSMGSVLAFEVALRFQRHTEVSPDWLFASGYPAPSRLRNGTVHRRDNAGLVRELRELGGIDLGWLDDADLLATILPPLRADYHAIETHPRTVEKLRDVPVTILTGHADPHTTPDEAQAWREITSGDFALHVFPGGHFYLDEHLPAVAGHVSVALGHAIDRTG
jgi:surfactin synthase thioesterase subunit